MITHQNHKFIYNGITSLELPNGMYLNYGMSQDIFEIVSPDGGFRLVVEFYNSTKSPRRDLEEWCYCVYIGVWIKKGAEAPYVDIPLLASFPIFFAISRSKIFGCGIRISEISRIYANPTSCCTRG